MCQTCWDPKKHPPKDSTGLGYHYSSRILLFYPSGLLALFFCLSFPFFSSLSLSLSLSLFLSLSLSYTHVCTQYIPQAYLRSIHLLGQGAHLKSKRLKSLKKAQTCKETRAVKHSNAGNLERQLLPRKHKSEALSEGLPLCRKMWASQPCDVAWATKP